ncbi:hypothetical protein GCM10009077_41970 [Roseibium denhamense]
MGQVSCQNGIRALQGHLSWITVKDPINEMTAKSLFRRDGFPAYNQVQRRFDTRKPGRALCPPGSWQNAQGHFR